MPTVFVVGALDADAAMAQPAGNSLPAEQCITYRDNNAGGYQLVNQCDYPINVAWCSEPVAERCAQDQNWKQLPLASRAELPGQFVPAQSISLFACRAPAAVKLLSGNMAECQPETRSGKSPLPWLPAASLKNPGAIITANDYPLKLENISGTTRFDMTVGADGKPLSCSVTASSGHATLDNAACKAFLKRARFSPVKDASGKPVTGRYKGAVTWKVP